MKTLFRIAPLVFFLLVPALAADPGSGGLRGTFTTVSAVPPKTAFSACATAAELLSRHVKFRDGNHLSQSTHETAEKWWETHGLNLTRVTARAVTNADKAHGIAESYLVSVDAKMFRTYDVRTAKWSQWHNGRNFFLPPAIKVVRGTNGVWTAHAPSLSNLLAFTARGNPALIPHGSKPIPAAKPSLVPAPANPKKPQAPGKVNAPVAKMADGFNRTVNIVAIMLVSIPFFFLLVAGTLGRIARPHQPSRPVPPARPSCSAPLSPPLPEHLAYPEIEMIAGNSHLLTPAEQAFHAVLEPLVRHACAISTKVRLADLFSVTPGRGQQAAFNKISRKHIDFVLTEPATSRILCAIELDDSSHKRPDRIGRDDFVNELFAAKGMHLLRVPFALTYNVPGLRAQLLKAGVPLANAA